MPAMDACIEFLPADGEEYIEVKIDLEFDYQPAEAAVMDPDSALAGPGCDASAELIEDSIKRADGEPVCAALLTAVKDWWERAGEAEAIEIGDDGLPRTRRARRMCRDED